MNKIKTKLYEFNIYIALNLAKLLSSMSFFWLCTSLILVAIIIPSLAPQCSFIAQTIIQLLALPVLGLAQDIQSTRIESKIDCLELELKEHISKLLQEILTCEKEELHYKIGENNGNK